MKGSSDNNTEKSNIFHKYKKLTVLTVVLIIVLLLSIWANGSGPAHMANKTAERYIAQNHSELDGELSFISETVVSGWFGLFEHTTAYGYWYESEEESLSFDVYPGWCPVFVKNELLLPAGWEEEYMQAEIDCDNINLENEREIKEVQQPLESSAEPNDDEMVKVDDFITDIFTELKYATDDNFTGVVIYDFTDAYLRYGTVKKLILIQEMLKDEGYSLKIWDAYRPAEAQFELWRVYPNPEFVANPMTGYSSHSKGNTVDVTLVKIDGSEVEMPTEFDDFSELADRDYSDLSGAAAKNVKLLDDVMTEGGFEGYFGEWWHFSDAVDYPVIDEFQ